MMFCAIAVISLVGWKKKRKGATRAKTEGKEWKVELIALALHGLNIAIFLHSHIRKTKQAEGTKISQLKQDKDRVIRTSCLTLSRTGTNTALNWRK